MVNGNRLESLHLVLFLLLAFAIGGLGADLLVVLLEGGKVLTGLGELTFLHTLTDVPVDERTLGVHKVELVVDTGQSLGHSSGVGNHGTGAHDLGKVAAGHDSGWLVVDATLEAGGTPVDELDGALRLDGGDSGVHVLGDDITTVHQADSHVFTVTGVTLGEHGGGLEHRVGDLAHGQLLVVRLLSRDDRRVRRKHEVDTRVGHQVGLELGDVHVQGAIETQGGSQRGRDLRDDAVQVGVGRALNVEAAAAHIIDGLVVQAEGHISVLQQGVGGKHVIVRLDDSSGGLRGWGHGVRQLGLFAVVDGQTLQKKGAKTGAGTSASGVVDEETLQTSAVVRKLAHSVKDKVDNFLANGVVATGVVIGGIFLSGDQLLGVVQLTVRAGADLIDHSRLEVDVHSAGHVLASTSLREKGVESIVASTDGLIGRHLAVRLDTVLEAEKFPGGITDLDTGLAEVDIDNFTHIDFFVMKKKERKSF